MPLTPNEASSSPVVASRPESDRSARTPVTNPSLPPEAATEWASENGHRCSVIGHALSDAHHPHGEVMPVATRAYDLVVNRGRHWRPLGAARAGIVPVANRRCVLTKETHLTALLGCRRFQFWPRVKRSVGLRISRTVHNIHGVGQEHEDAPSDTSPPPVGVFTGLPGFNFSFFFAESGKQPLCQE